MTLATVREEYLWANRAIEEGVNLTNGNDFPFMAGGSKGDKRWTNF